MTNTQPVVVDSRGHEHHPAFGSVRVNRVSARPGVVLFDSDLRHQYFITLNVKTATRKRDHNHDYIYEGSELVDIALSEAQWAQLVSSVNGGATPVTLAWVKGTGSIPELPYEPRLGVSQAEVRKAAHETYEKVLAALDAYEEHKTAANLRNLRSALTNAEKNIAYTAQTLTEHAEAVTTKARADIEAMVNAIIEESGSSAALSVDTLMPKELNQ